MDDHMKFWFIFKVRSFHFAARLTSQSVYANVHWEFSLAIQDTLRENSDTSDRQIRYVDTSEKLLQLFFFHVRFEFSEDGGRSTGKLESHRGDHRRGSIENHLFVAAPSQRPRWSSTHEEGTNHHGEDHHWRYDEDDAAVSRWRRPPFDREYGQCHPECLRASFWISSETRRLFYLWFLWSFDMFDKKDQLFDWSIDWLIVFSIDRSVGWLLGWLIDWLIDWLMVCSFCSIFLRAFSRIWRTRRSSIRISEICARNTAGTASWRQPWRTPSRSSTLGRFAKGPNTWLMTANFCWRTRPSAILSALATNWCSNFSSSPRHRIWTKSRWKSIFCRWRSWRSLWAHKFGRKSRGASTLSAKNRAWLYRAWGLSSERRSLTQKPRKERQPPASCRKVDPNTGRQNVSRLVMTDWLIDCSSDWLIDWLCDLSFDSLFDWLIDCSTNWLNVCLSIDLLIGGSTWLVCFV